ncbi:hypothetical protein H6P81_003250 [Aristolochia fimbriata]|uniref:Uncharacterized protein n=1 Tax=Aristolochia fimbriata TaxID=158543 RepID=A0AAV7FFC0_ARIFI|nr:hypothetical protein H6P81_003250 [Aristolochia fimbriata]
MLPIITSYSRGLTTSDDPCFRHLSLQQLPTGRSTSLRLEKGLHFHGPGQLNPQCPTAQPKSPPHGFSVLEFFWGLWGWVSEDERERGKTEPLYEIEKLQLGLVPLLN